MLNSNKPGTKTLERFIERLSQANSRSTLLNCGSGTKSRDRVDITALHLPELGYGEKLKNLFLTSDSLVDDLHLTLPDSLVEEKCVDLKKHGVQNGEELDSALLAFRKEREVRLGTIRSRVSALVSAASDYRRDRGIDALWFAYPLVYLPASDREPQGSRAVKAKDAGCLAPVFLWPIHVSENSGKKHSWKIKLNGSDGRSIKVNTALLEWIKNVHNVEIDTPIEYFEDGIINDQEIRDFLARIEGALSLQKGSLELPATLQTAPETKAACGGVARAFNAGTLGLFSHQKESILRDTRAIHAGTVPSSQLLNSMLDGVEGAARQSRAKQSQINHPLSYVTALDCDYSQRKAALTGSMSGNLIIHGPPGTGKSQVISELIVQTLLQGKKVLVCCEKKVALEVIKKRLSKVGLSHLCALIQDPQRDRATIYNEFRGLKDSGQPRDFYDQRGQSLNTLMLEISTIESQLLNSNKLLFDRLEFGTTWNGLVAFHSKYSKILASRFPQDLSALRTSIPDIQAMKSVIEESRDLFVSWQAADVPRNPYLRKLDAQLNSYERGFQTSLETSVTQVQSALRALKLDLKDQTVGSDLISELLETGVAELLTLKAVFQQNSNLSREGKLVLSAILNAILRGVDWNASAQALTDQYVKANGSVNLSLSDFFGKMPERHAIESARQDAADLADVEEKGSWWANLTHRSVKSRLNKFLKTCALPNMQQLSYAEILALLKKAAEFSALCRQLADLQDNLGIELIRDTNPTRMHWHGILSAAKVVCETTSSIAKIAGVLGENLSTNPSGRRLVELCLTSLDAKEPAAAVVPRILARIIDLRIKAEALAAYLSKKQGAIFVERFFARMAKDRDESGAVERTLVRMHGYAGKTKELLRYEDKLRKASKPLQNFIRVLEKWTSAVSHRDWEAAIAYKVSREQLDAALKTRIDLHHISSIALDEWKLRLEQAVSIAKSAVVDVVKSRWQHQRDRASEVMTTSELIKRFPLRGKTRRSFRETLDSNRDFALNFFPLWMGNPDAICSVLPLEPNLFDVVIFDEASQCRPEDSLPVIYRAKRLVVAGDDKQMPPSDSFRQRSHEFDHEADDDDDYQALHEQELLQDGDLLSMAKKLHMQECQLLLHYRSAKRELIEFSNRAFYGGQLKFVPKAQTCREPGIELIQVSGVYEGQMNQDEAEAVVARLKSMMQQDQIQSSSVGVVTFNLKQSEAVKEKIQEAKYNDPEFSAYMTRLASLQDDGEDRSFFVKNLEEVQGDERDVLIISTTFGRSAAGRFIRNFGTIINVGGDRRLNVLVTRAKSKMVVLTSIPEGEYSQPLDDILNASRERSIFYGYLRYARAVAQGNAAEVDEVLGWLSKRFGSEKPICAEIARGRSEGFAVESPLEAEIAEYLEARYPGRIALQVSVGSFRIDLAIRDKVDPAKYILGIEADGYAYHSDPLKIDEDRTRQRILERLGWRIERILSTDWWDDHEKHIRRICEVIADLDAMGDDGRESADAPLLVVNRKRSI